MHAGRTTAGVISRASALKGYRVPQVPGRVPAMRRKEYVIGNALAGGLRDVAGMPCRHCIALQGLCPVSPVGNGALQLQGIPASMSAGVLWWRVRVSRG